MLQFKKLKEDIVLNFFLSKYIMSLIFVGTLTLIILGFIHFLGGKDIIKMEFGPLGLFIAGVATFMAVLFGGSYWINKKSDGAIELLRVFNLHINNMLEIMQHPMTYQRNGYYPFNYPETHNGDANIYWERPCRLLYNEFGILKKQISLYSSFLRGENLEQLIELENEVEKIVMEINSWLLIKLADQNEAELVLQNYDNFLEYKNNLISISTKFKNFLGPFI